MTELAVQSAAAFLAIFGFSIILDVPKKFLLYAGAAGGVCWFVYLLALQAGRSLIMAAFLSSLVVSILSHIFARVLKAPVRLQEPRASGSMTSARMQPAPLPWR